MPIKYIITIYKGMLEKVQYIFTILGLQMGAFILMQIKIGVVSADDYKKKNCQKNLLWN